MDNNFWQKLKKPFVGMSPMDGYTDFAFRQITVKYGQPDVMFTEFVAVDALVRFIDKAIEGLKHSKNERPIVAQLFGIEPELFYFSAQMIAALGFDGVDINMGCPAKKIALRGAGAGLIQTPDLAAQIIEATKRGIQDYAKDGLNKTFLGEWPVHLSSKQKKCLFNFVEKYENESKDTLRPEIPVSIKTRTGHDSHITEEWIKHIASQNVAAISIHGRTLKQAYAGQASWEEIAKAAKVIRSISPETVVIGNGDIQDRDHALEMAERYGVDGVLIGRAAVGNPWVFIARANRSKISWEEKKKIILEHARLFEENKSPQAFKAFRKILLSYFKAFEGAKDMRKELVQTTSAKEVEKIL